METYPRHYLSLLAGPLFLALASTTSLAATNQGAQTPPSVIAFNQQVKNDQVKITYAYLPSDGFVEVFQSNPQGDSASKSIGQAEMKAGDHRDFQVKLNVEPQKGSLLWIALANDDSQQWKKTLPAANKIKVE
jgi:hypothetical protein